VLPLVDFAAARPYRSLRYEAVPAVQLSGPQVLELAREVGASFARREPQCRHVQPALAPPAALHGAEHTDPFGRASFGPWTRETLLAWFIRLCVLTDPTSPRGAIGVSEDTLKHSLAVVDGEGRVIGGALNETMPPVEAAPAFREDDPFLAAALAYVHPVLELLAAQDAEAVGALCARFPEFRAAYARRAVGHHFMVARSDALPTADAFELVAATAERFRALGKAFMLVEASNQWTGAACEVLRGVRVHFAAYRDRPRVPRSAVPRPDVTTSPDGYIAGKDSGCMFYVIRLE
jgi:hypothetical protein